MANFSRGLAGLVAAGVLSSAAFAGQTQPAVVQVELGDGIGSATGDLITARTDKDDEVFIGCGTRNFEDGVGGLFSTAFCQARDAEGDQATCFATNPDLIQTIREINDFSFVTFGWTDDGSGNLTCRSLDLI